MRWRIVVLVVVILAAAPMILLAGWWVWYEFREPAGIIAHGDDPLIFENQGPAESIPGRVISGTLEYDPDDRCLYLILDPTIEVEDSQGRPISGGEQAEPLRTAILWPRATRPVRDGDGRGVAVDAFLGRFGGDEVWAGQHIAGEGWVAVAAPDDQLVVGRCGTDQGAIAIFNNAESLVVAESPPRQ